MIQVKSLLIPYPYPNHVAVIFFQNYLRDNYLLKMQQFDWKYNPRPEPGRKMAVPGKESNVDVEWMAVPGLVDL